MIPEGRVVEYLFVDPNTWSGEGEIVRDPIVIAGWKRRFASMCASAYQRRLVGLPLPRYLALAEEHAPSDERTMLVRKEVM